MNFAEAARTNGALTRTENGAVALNTTGSKLLDFYSTVGSLRTADDIRINRLFADAYNEDPLLLQRLHSMVVISGEVLARERLSEPLSVIWQTITQKHLDLILI